MLVVCFLNKFGIFLRLLRNFCAFCVRPPYFSANPLRPLRSCPRIQAQQSGAGKQFSAVYFANVLGSALGPVVTGYVLLEYLTLFQPA